jgi:hypothetical protein
MSVGRTLWRSLVEQTVRWQTRPRQVWSTYGGEQRQVTVVWPVRERGLLWYRALRALVWLAVAGLGVLISAAIIEEQGWAPERSDGLRSALDESDPTYGVVLFAAFVGLTLVGMAAVGLLHLLLRLYGLVAPLVVEGVALRYQIQVTSRSVPNDAEGPQSSFAYSRGVGPGDGLLHRHQRYYLALDVGTETARAHRVRKRWYDLVTNGDAVRVTMVPVIRKVRRVEILHDVGGRSNPSPSGRATMQLTRMPD